MKTLGIVPARKGSQRFPNKHHTPLLGRPMFAYTLEAARASELLSKVVVSSDDLQLQSLTEQYGFEFIRRPEKLSTLTSPLEDALRHACRLLKQRDQFQPDAVVVLLGNIPVRKSGQIDAVIRRLGELPEATAICTAQEVRLRPEWMKVLKERDSGQALPFLTGNHPYRAQDCPKLYLMDGAVAAVRRETLFATEGDRSLHAWLGERTFLFVQDHPMFSLEVDYPDQRELAEWYLRHAESLIQK